MVIYDLSLSTELVISGLDQCAREEFAMTIFWPGHFAFGPAGERITSIPNVIQVHAMSLLLLPR